MKHKLKFLNRSNCQAIMFVWQMTSFIIVIIVIVVFVCINELAYLPLLSVVSIWRVTACTTVCLCFHHIVSFTLSPTPTASLCPFWLSFPLSLPFHSFNLLLGTNYMKRTVNQMQGTKCQNTQLRTFWEQVLGLNTTWHSRPFSLLTFWHVTVGKAQV